MEQIRRAISKLYDRFSTYSLAELQDLFKEKVLDFVQWLDGFTERCFHRRQSQMGVFYTI